MAKIKWILVIIMMILLVYTRFVNLSWGLPYPMHPDERNMVNALQQLQCKFSIFNFQLSKGCLNPHFFAYGQFPLYIAYIIIQINHLFTQRLAIPISFEEGAIALRVISAIASVVNALILLMIVKLLIYQNPKSKLQISNLILLFIIIFSPFFIQFSHFGTTESLLMMFYSLIIYVTILFIQGKILNSKFLILTSIIGGVAIATKVSAVVFLAVPILGELGDLGRLGEEKIKEIFFRIIRFFTLTLLITIIFSPYNFISFYEFLGSMKYESDVALGRYVAFYIRQFVSSVPVIFQFTKIFPYALGWPIFIIFILGFIFLSWKDKSINLLRFAFIVYFFPNAFIFAKWTRFMTPVMPIMIVFAVLFLTSLFKTKNLIIFIIIIISIIPGIAFLNIYQNPDVRFKASEWVYNHIPENALILSETANVVDIPIPSPNMKYPMINYHYISFDFYHLDKDKELQQQLDNYINTADYIFIPSRRVFANHSKDKYPVLNSYYQRLFSGEMGFQKVAEFSSYPRISLLGKTLIEFPDERAEETWTVFDHPVIRIYKRVNRY